MMFHLASSVLCVLALSSATVASPAPSSALAPRVLGLDFERQLHPQPAQKLRRRGSASAPLYPLQNGWIYVANVSIGTPPVNVSMQLDTGSSDFWINSPTSAQCTNGTGGCPFGTYIANNSQTYQYLNSQLNDSYLAGTVISGDMATDVVNFGGSTLKGFQFGIAYSSNNIVNLWGIGLQASEGFGSGLVQYNNSPLQMVDQGLIQSATYSIWLNNLNSSAGSVLFGGIDTSKYQGTLATLPVQPNPNPAVKPNTYDQMRVNMSSISLNGNVFTNSSKFPSPVLLDTGNPLIIIPDDAFKVVVAQLNLTDTVISNIALPPCSLASSSAVFTFEFSGVNISVPISSVILPATTIALQAYTGGRFPVPPPGICALVVVPQSLTNATDVTLGDTFLQNAYAVFDLANLQVSLAPSNPSPGSSNVVEIAAGKGGVAALSATGASPASSTTSAGSSIPTATTTGSASGASTSTSPSSTITPSPKSGASSVGSGMQAGALLSAALVLLGLASFL